MNNNKEEVIKKWRFQNLPSNPDRFEASCSIFRTKTITTNTSTTTSTTIAAVPPTPVTLTRSRTNNNNQLQSRNAAAYYVNDERDVAAPAGVYYQYNCILCGHDSDRLYSKQGMVQHCQDPNHCAMVQDIIAAQNEAKEDMLECLVKYDAIIPRVARLGLPRWQHHVRSDLCTYLGSVGEDHWPFVWAVNNLLKYEHLERISILELAAWKAACIMDLDETLSFYDMMEWLNNGWRKNKTKLQRCTATTVIVQNVVAFLEVPRLLSNVRSCFKALMDSPSTSST